MVVISAKYIKQFAPVAMVTAHILECLPGSKTFSRHPGGTLVFREPALGLGKKKKNNCRRKTFEGSVSAGLRFLDSRAAQVMENTSNYGVTIIREVPPSRLFLSAALIISSRFGLSNNATLLPKCLCEQGRGYPTPDTEITRRHYDNIF